MLPFVAMQEALEHTIVRRTVDESLAAEPETWGALARCGMLAIYTDGSAPVANPGGPCGFAAVIVGGREAPCDAASTPTARLDLAGHIPARSGEPATSNNRAEVAGLMAALAALAVLPEGHRRATVWADSDYAINCATGRYKRKKNLDLWRGYDALDRQARVRTPAGIDLHWLKGHAGDAWNAAADELATRAAFNFDASAHAHFREAQRQSGREMPPPAVLLAAGFDGPTQPELPAVADPAAWIRGAHYTLVLCTHIDGGSRPYVGRGPATGIYQLWTRGGKGARSTVRHDGERGADEADYLTLIAALADLTARVEAGGNDPAAYTLTVYSRRELPVGQLRGTRRTQSPTLQPLQEQAQAQLRRFREVELIWKPGPSIERLLHP